MRTRSFSFSLLFSALFLTACLSVYGQGNSGNRPGGGGPPANPGGRPTGSPGVDRGIDRARIGSGGRIDTGLGTASDRSRGRSDNGINRARNGGSVEGIPVEIDDRRFTGLARKLDTTPEALREAYELSRQTNEDLPFGLFVAANVIADHLSVTHPQITSEAILLGLENGRSLGQTLQDLGFTSDEAKFLKKTAREKIEKGDEQ